MSNDEKLNALIIQLKGKIQTTHYEDLIEDERVYHVCRNFDCVIDFVCKDGDIDKHRWYEMIDAIYKVIDDTNSVIGYIESPVISQLYSEQSSWSDISHQFDFCIVEPYTETVTITKFRKVKE